MTKSARSFALDIPPDWLVIDLESRERIPAQLAALIEEAVEKDPAVADHRGMIEGEIRSVLRQARSAELSLCAMLSTMIDDVLPMFATLTIAHRPLAEASDVSAMFTTLQRRHGANVSKVELAGVGAAVRAVYRDKASHGSLDQPIEASLAQYFIPARANTVAVITGATPILPLADHFTELFDAIADSFVFVEPEPVSATR